MQFLQRPFRPVRRLKAAPPHSLPYRSTDQDQKDQTHEKLRRLALWQLCLAIMPFLGLILTGLSWWLLSTLYRR